MSAIPRTFHMIWLGPRPLEKMYLAFAMTWRRYHPGWSLVLWQDHKHHYTGVFDDVRSVESLSVANRDLLDTSPSWAAKSNILRLEIIARHGGVYLDTDFICHRSIDMLLEGIGCFVGDQDDEFINNAIFGATPGHSEIVRAIRQLPTIRASTTHCPEIATGPHLFTQLFRINSAVTVFDRKTFYPLSWQGRYECGDAGAYATHLWAFSWSAEARPGPPHSTDEEEPERQRKRAPR